MWDYAFSVMVLVSCSQIRVFSDALAQFSELLATSFFLTEWLVLHAQCFLKMYLIDLRPQYLTG